MTSTAGSTTPSVPDRAVTRAAVVTHGKTGQIGAGLARLQAVASEHAVELLFSPEESEKHALDRTADPARADIAVVLGGDGTMLRALTRFLGTGVPVIGVNFGRVGFLSSMGRRDLEAGHGRVDVDDADVREVGEPRRAACVGRAVDRKRELVALAGDSDHLGGADLRFQIGDARLDEALPLAGRVVLRILAEVAVGPGLRDGAHDARALPLEALHLVAQPVVAGAGHRGALDAHDRITSSLRFTSARNPLRLPRCVRWT